MNLVQNIVFEYSIGGSGMPLSGEFTNFEDLKKVVNAGNSNDPTAKTLTVSRIIKIADTKKDNQATRRFSSFEHAENGIEVARESLSFVICAKLVYPCDISAFLKKKYGSSLNFASKDWAKKDKPVVFSGVHEQTRHGLRNPKTGMPTQYTLRNVNCRVLSEDDVVLDKDLNQIWPVNAKGGVPLNLTEMLCKGKERIY